MSWSKEGKAFLGFQKEDNKEPALLGKQNA